MMGDYDYENSSYEYLEYGDFDDSKEGYTQKEVLHIISVVVYSISFVVGTLGNGIVIWLTGFRSKQTVSSVWLLNLAVADFVFVVSLPISIDYVLRDFHWKFGQVMCKLNSFICTVNMYASVLFLTAISLDRYVSLVHLNWSQRYRTLRHAWFVCRLIWVISGLLSCPALIFRETAQVHNKVVCFNNFHDESGHVVAMRHFALVIVRTTVGFLLPFCAISISGILLAFKMRTLNSVRVSSFSRTVSAVILAFFVCWVPFHTFSVMELSMHHSLYLFHVLRIGFPLASSLAFLNGCVNPILYVLLSKKVRTMLKQSCLVFSKRSLQELSQSVSGTESVSMPTNCPAEEPTASSIV
ncbi:G-protein coupled receptor 1 [Chanos chanos]|uniref:G-protein coupled receptor 1 n=1 Tax=Chanos chanos TaxID=29144 RepID=A0A6J2WAP3_CHACN|nr:G-protein coupled receptor 1 [Chanos chanos]